MMRLTAAVIGFLLLAGIAAASGNTILQFTVTGLPPGTNVPIQVQNPVGTYTTENFQMTGWTTVFQVTYNSAVISTYSGNVPYQFEGNGTAITGSDGNQYTINEIAGSGYKGMIMSSSGYGTLPFYGWTSYLNNALEEAGVPANTAVLITGLQNTTINPVYNGTSPAGTVVRTATLNNGNLTSNVGIVQKAQPGCSIDTQRGSVGKAGTYAYPIAIVSGHVGFTGAASYPVSGNIVCSNLNALNTTYSVVVNGITVSSGMLNTTTLTDPFSFTASIGEQWSIGLSAEGNANYITLTDPTFDPPANINYYSNITLSAAANTFDLLIPFNALKTCNALLCASNLDNIEFFYPNGTIVKSWLQGNALNGQSNALSSAANVLWWVSLNAGAGTTANVIAMGFASNSVNLLNGNTVGEAPQLSCTTPTNTISGCGTSQYAQYDNGNVVFPFYSNFVNNNAWNTITGTVTFANGLSQNGVTGIITKTASTHPLTEEAYLVSFTSGVSAQSGAYESTSSSTSTDCGSPFVNNEYLNYLARYSPQQLTVTYSTTSACGNVGDTTITTLTIPTILFFYWPATGTELAQGGSSNAIAGTDSSIAIGNLYFGLDSLTANALATYQWIAGMTPPANNLQPTVTFGNVIVAPVTLTATPNPYTVSNLTIDVGQVSTGNTVISGGTSGTTSYTGNVYYSMVSGNVVAGNTISKTLPTSNNALTFTANAETSNTLGLTFNGVSLTLTATGTNTIYGIWTFNAFATDSSGDQSPSPQLTNTITVNPAFINPSITPSSTETIDSGQGVVFNSVVTGGTNNYQTTLYSSTTSTCNTAKTVVQKVTGLTSGAETFTVVSPTSNTYYCISWEDSASTPVNVISSTVEIVVNSALSANAVVPNLPTIDNGQSITLTAGATGGDPAYTWAWYSTGTAAHAAASCGTGSWSSASTTTQTYSPSPSSNTWYCFTVSDASSNAPTVGSANDLVTVSSTYQTPTVANVPSTIDSGQSILLTVTASGGTSPYNAILYTGASGNNCAQDASNILGTHNRVTSPNSFTISPTTTNSYCIGLTDNAYQPQTVNSVAGVVTVNGALGTPSILPPNPTIDNGQSIIFTSSWTGGTINYQTTLHSSSSGTCNVASTIVQIVTGLSTNSVTFSSVAPTSNTWYCISLEDNSLLPENTLSGTSEIAVNNALGTPTLNPSTTQTIQGGNSITFNVMWSGGTPAYVANLISGNSASCLSDSTLVQSVSGATSVTTFNPVSPTSNTYYCATVTDNAYSPSTVNSITTEVIVLIGPPIVTVNPSQYIIWGTPTNVVVTGNPSVDNVIANVVLPNGQTVTLGYGTGTQTYNFPYNAEIGKYNLIVTDQNSLQQTVLDPWVYTPVYVETTSTTYNTIPNAASPVQAKTNLASANNANYSITYSSSTTLSGNVYAYSVFVNSGQTLTTNGYWIIAVNSIINNGVITTGYLSNGGSGGSNSGGGGSGKSVSSSYGGSGGGGGNTNGGSGGSTQAAGGSASNAGSAPSAPNTISMPLFQAWYANYSSYLTGAGGGGGGGGGSGCTCGYAGGNGAYGLYMQANTITAGTVNAIGASGTSGGGGGSAGGGGGGGGVIVIAHGAGTYIAGTYNYNGGSGGVGASYTGGAGGAGNIIVYAYSTQPEGIQNPQNSLGAQTLPILIYTQSPNSLISYSLEYNTNTALQTAVANVNYVVPANSPVSIYAYTVVETQAGNTVYVNDTIEPLSNSLLTSVSYNSYSNGCIQYYPCLATAVWASPPISWSIKSDVPQNQQSNTVAGEVFSNANLTFRPFLSAVYSFVTVNVSLPSITQAPFLISTSNAVPDLRNIVNISNYAMRDLQAIPANTQYSLTVNVNNYTTALFTNGLAANTELFYVPQSTFINPALTLNKGLLQSTASGYVGTTNNECTITLANGQAETYNAYLPDSNSNSTSYSIEIFQGASYTGTGDYFQVLKGASSATATLVQQYLIGVVPFSLTLPAPASYGFALYNPCGTEIHATNFTQWISPIQIFLNSTSNTPVISVPNITVTCQKFPTSNTLANIECAGMDTKSIINSWNLTLYNNSVVAGWVISNSMTLSGNAFTITFYGASNTLPLQTVVKAAGGIYAQVFTFSFNDGVSYSGLSLEDRAFLTILFLLVGLGLDIGGAGTGIITTRHMISTTFMIEAVMVGLTYILGISIFGSSIIPALMIVFLIIMGAIMYGHELNAY